MAQLLDARTGAAADSALAGLSGGLTAAVSRLRGEAIDMLAEFEARLDFDENLPTLDLAVMQARIADLTLQVPCHFQNPRIPPYSFCNRDSSYIYVVALVAIHAWCVCVCGVDSRGSGDTAGRAAAAEWAAGGAGGPPQCGQVQPP